MLGLQPRDAGSNPARDTKYAPSKGLLAPGLRILVAMVRVHQGAPNLKIRPYRLVGQDIGLSIRKREFESR